MPVYVAYALGHHWHVSTHKEDVPPDEMERRAAAMAKGG